MQDSGSGTYVQDIPFRWIPVMVSGLAYHLAMKIQGIDPQRVLALKADYEEKFMEAAQEDREAVAIRFVPRSLFYSR